MSHTSKFPPLKYTTATLPTDLPVGTVAFDTTANEHKSFNGSSWDVIEGGSIGTPTILFREPVSHDPLSYDQIQGDIPYRWKFYDQQARGLVIGTSCKSIGSEAFGYTYGLENNLVIPNSVTSIGDEAFFNCIFISGTLTISNSVRSIGQGAFSLCMSLTNVDCYVEKSVFDVTNCIQGAGVTTIHVRSIDSTWTAGPGQTIGGKSNITVIKDL